jgi:hypothetical protein
MPEWVIDPEDPTTARALVGEARDHCTRSTTSLQSLARVSKEIGSAFSRLKIECLFPFAGTIEASGTCV